MKKLFTILLFLCSLNAFSQTNTGKIPKWEVGLLYSQDFYRSTSVAANQNSGYYLEPYDLNFTAGLTGQLTLIPKVEFLTGITYSKKDFAGTYYCHVCDFSALPELEPIRQRYLEIPALVRYNILETKLGLSMEAGLLGGYRINDIETQFDNSELFGSRYLLSGQVGFGTSYDFGEKVSLSLKTVYRQSLKNYSKAIDSDLGSFGLVTGISYKMN